MNENTLNKIIEALDEMTKDELIQVHAQYCDAINNYDDYIYSMWEFNDIMYGQTADWIANRIFYGDFNPNYDYFKFDGYGNLQSICNYELKDYIDIDEIAQYIIDTNNALDNDDIQNILDEQEDAEQ